MVETLMYRRNEDWIEFSFPYKLPSSLTPKQISNADTELMSRVLDYVKCIPVEDVCET